MIRVLPKTLFDFGYLPASTTDEVIVAKALNVIPYGSAHLWVRVYQLRLGSDARAQVTVNGALPADDAQQPFLDSTATVLKLTGTAPLLLNASLTSAGPLPPYLQIAVEAAQPLRATNIGLEISIDVLVRCCG